jgi:hypothetical protein
VFVGALCVTAVFLITYKVLEHNLDNTASIVAGAAALGVALFPTRRSDAAVAAGIGPTPLQESLGETFVAVLHFGCAVVFIGLLGVISFFFGKREGRRSQSRGNHRTKRSPLFWQWFHWTCTAVIVLAIVFLIISKVAGLFDGFALLITETVAVLAFGTSWLMKGLELDVLRPRPVKGPDNGDHGGVGPSQTRQPPVGRTVGMSGDGHMS